MILIILGNTVTYSLFDYTDRDRLHTWNKTLHALDFVYVMIYIFESVCKIIAKGLIGNSSSYLRDGWDLFDIFIIIMGILSLIPPLDKNRGIHTLCIPRIIKLTYTSSTIYDLMTPWMLSLKHMGDVALLVCFILSVFSIIGYYLFKGTSFYRCRYTPEPVNGVWEVDSSIIRLCSAFGGGDYECPADRYCGSPDMYDLPISSERIEDRIEVYYGTLGYDNFYVSFLSSIQVITLDNWADLMYKGSDSNNSFFGRVYFPILAFVGAYFCLNLIVAVVFDTFQNFKQLIHEKEASKQLPADEDNKKPTDNESSVVQNSQGIFEDIPTIRILGSKRLPANKQIVVKTNEEFSCCSLIKRCAIGRNVNKIYSKIKDMCKSALSSKYYKYIMIILILGNLFAQCFNRHNISEYETRLIDGFDMCFVFIFVLEMFMGILAYDFVSYIKNPLNILDVVLNVFGIIEVAMTYSFDSKDYTVRGVIVIIRAFRALKLISKWNKLKNVLYFMWTARGDIINFTIVVIIFVFMFAIIGMELFANEVKFDKNDKKDLVNGLTPRVMNFDDLAHALLSAFSIQNGDGWTTYYILYLRYKPFEATVYYISAIIILNIILVGLLLGIILQNFFSDEQKDKMAEEEKISERFYSKYKKIRREVVYKKRVRTLLLAFKLFKVLISDPKKKILISTTKDIYNVEGISFNIFTEKSYIRYLCVKIVTHKVYKILTYIMIAINSIVLTMYTPLVNTESTLYKFAYVVDWIATIFFTIDIFMKAIAFGFLFNGDKSFLRVPLNVLSLIATIAEIMSLIWNSDSYSVIKILALFRLLRTVKFVAMNKGLRTRARALIRVMPDIFQILLVVVFMILIFALIGIQYFKGMYYFCDYTVALPREEIITVYDCLNYGGEWRARDIGYDNVLIAGMTLFEIFTGESWVFTITFSADFVGEDYEPKTDVSMRYLWYGLIYTIISFIFMRGVFTGVISDAFFSSNEKLQGLKKLTTSQMRWVSFSGIIFKANPVKEVNIFNVNIVWSTIQILRTLQIFQ